MRFTETLVINRPIEHVWRAFDDPEDMKRWQPTLASFEHISGERGQPGSKSRIVYQEGKRRIEMTETLLERSEHQRLSGIYEVGGSVSATTSRIDNEFEDLGGSTRWTMESEFEFTRAERFIMPFMKWIFVRRTRDDMRRFKEMVETNNN